MKRSALSLSRFKDAKTQLQQNTFPVRSVACNMPLAKDGREVLTMKVTVF
jgi:hypothetical protein